MIRANDLRIGNTIKWLHEEHETFHTVDAEMISLIDKYNKTPDDDIFSRGFWYASIPLTPEILVKCGFKPHGKGIVSLENTAISLRAEDDAWSLAYYGTTIKYLHQLQNVVFALSGEELQIENL